MSRLVDWYIKRTYGNDSRLTGYALALRLLAWCAIFAVSVGCWWLIVEALR